MLTNKAIAAAVVTAFVGQTTAFNTHRHLHRQVEKQLDKRALEVDWVTVWETVYVTAGQEPEPTVESKPEGVPAVPAAEPTTTSTTSIVVEPTEAPVVEEPAPPAPAPEPTTLATSVKPAAPPAQEPSPEPQPEQPEVEQPQEEETSEKIDPVLNPGQPQENKETETPSKPASGGNAFSSKRGVAYNDPDLATHFGASCESCSWAWNWGSSSSGMEGMNFVPTLWGIETMHTDHWDEDCEKAIQSGSKALLSFNEPDHADQAAIPAAVAAQNHAKYFNKYSGQALIGSPSVTNSGNPGEGLEYLQEFMDHCNALDGGCAIDFCNVHWYSEAAYSDTLFTHLEEAHKICNNKPIWLTEFAPLDSDPAVKDQFMKDIIPQLDEISYLHAYSYFMVALDNLMSSSSTLSSFGELYASV